MPAAACALYRAPAFPMEEPLDAPRDDPQSFQRQRMAGDFTDLSAFDAFNAIAVIPTPAAPTRPRPRGSGAVGAHGRVAHHRNRPTGIAVTPAPLGALPVLVTTVTPAVFKPWGQTRFQRH